MYTEIKAAVDSVKVISDILRASKDLRNFNELASAVAELNVKLVSATAAALSSQENESRLAERIRTLEAELTKLEDWKTQIARYRLFEFPATGALAYTLQPGMEQGQPMHYLCVACADKHQISKLQPVNERHSLRCEPCNTTIHIAHSPTPKVNKGHGGFMSR